MVTSVTTSSKHPDVPSNESVQNEPNSEKTLAGSESHEGCEQGSRKIDIVTPTKLAPLAPSQARDDEKEARDRT